VIPTKSTIEARPPAVNVWTLVKIPFESLYSFPSACEYQKLQLQTLEG
jgi:hypothetical protein